jgi:hypothetical protein
MALLIDSIYLAPFPRFAPRISNGNKLAHFRCLYFCYPSYLSRSSSQRRRPREHLTYSHSMSPVSLKFSIKMVKPTKLPAPCKWDKSFHNKITASFTFKKYISLFSPADCRTLISMIPCINSIRILSARKPLVRQVSGAV